MLKIRRLYSEGSYETPFDKNIDGFEEKWWSQLVFDAMSSRDEFYSFTNEAEEEVARAWVDWRDYADTYAGINIDHEESYRYLYLLKSEEIVADVESARRQLIFYLLDLITLRFWLFLKL